MQGEVKERNERPETMQRARCFRTTDDGEKAFGPVGVIKLKRHAGDDEEKKTGDDQKVQEALKRDKACEPFVIGLRFDLGLAYFLLIVQIKIKGPEEPNDGMQTEEGKYSDEQAGHAQKHSMKQRIILWIKRIGVRLVFREFGGGTRVALLTSAQDVGLGESGCGIRGRKDIVMSVTVIAGGDI